MVINEKDVLVGGECPKCGNRPGMCECSGISNRFRVCKMCSIPHIENCEFCFGFGFHISFKHKHSLVPISGGEAAEGTHNENYLICPNCGGTPFGINKEV